MNPNKVIIKFEQVCDQASDPIRRLVGFVKAKYLIDLIEAADLNANPRSAKVGNVTEDIIESIKKTRDIFPFKTKGILLAVSTPPKDLERKRYELEFKDHEIEGILDGGHNTLAIAIHILNLATEEDRAVRKIKRWSDLKETWSQFKDKVADVRDQLDFLVPVEILVPANDSEDVIERFKDGIREICDARNNNVQLIEDTKADKAGHYDSIKLIVDPSLKEQIIWKQNTSGRVPVRDLIALSWIALGALKLPPEVSIPAPTKLYSGKPDCLKAFISLMETRGISSLESGKFELTSSSVASALNLLKDMPKLYDLIYEMFPDAYNKAGGRFGKIGGVKKYDPKKYKEDPKSYLKNRPLTPFYAKEVDYQCPEGFITPLVYALSALIEEKEGKLDWKVDPYQFVQKSIGLVLQQYKGVIDMSQWDPQKVGKSSLSYAIAKQQFEHFLLTQAHQTSII